MSETSESEFLEKGSCEKCGSSDASALYSDGHRFCFSCETYTPGEGEASASRRSDPVAGDMLRVDYVDLPKRGLTKETCQKFRYGINENRQVAGYCSPDGRLVAQKLRYADKSSMPWVGETSEAGLFGQQLWAPGGKRIVVTEGELDAMSVSQAMGNTWPVVSISKGAKGARKELAKHLEYLESFGIVVLMFDMDEPGRSAAAECAELFTPGKCALAQLPLKDASDMLQAGRTKELVSAVWQAKAYRPDGIVEGVDLWEQVSSKPEHGLSYPWTCLDRMLYGQRPREIVTWTGGTGLGKSQFLRELAFHLTTNHGKRVGIVSLEESVKTAALGQMSLAAGKRLHLPPVREATSEAELKSAFDLTMGSGRYVLYDHFGSVDADTLIPKIRFLAVGCGASHIMVDHISLAVSGMASQGGERERIDTLMTKLRTLAEELNICLHIVSHLRKADGKPHEEGGQTSLVDLRGSGSIAQLSNVVIGLERNQQADGEAAFVTNVRVLKNRYAGVTGLAGSVRFDLVTGRLVEEAAAAAVAVAAERKRPQEGDF